MGEKRHSLADYPGGGALFLASTILLGARLSSLRVQVEVMPSTMFCRLFI